MMMQTWKWTELLQMLGENIVGSHSRVSSQALGEVSHGLVDVFLWHLVCKATYNSSVVLDFAWSLWYFSSMAPQM